jgi:RNA polymerase sigma-70 factor (ECF subfamily)
MNEISRESIIQAAGGDMEAFEALYKATSGFVYNVALRIAQKTSDAEEITQDVFMKIHRNLKEFSFKSSFKTWAYRITVNTALNHCRASMKDKDVIDMENVGELASQRNDLKEKIDRQDSEAKVSEMLAALSPEQRAIIILREIEGLDYKEIAETLNIPINTVRSRLKRSREELIVCAKKGVASHEVR